MNCAHAQERVVDTMWGMALARSLDWLKRVFFFVFVSTSGASDWQHARIRAEITEQPSFFFKIVIDNPLT